MADLTGFDAEQIDPNFSFEPLPEGDYVAAIVESELKPNSAGTGKVLELKFQVLDGPYKSREVRSWLNLDHPNETAQKIAQAELSAICRAVNVLRPRDSAELHNLPLVISVKQRKRKDTGEMSNEIRAYKSRKSAAPAATPAAESSVPPWKR